MIVNSADECTATLRQKTGIAGFCADRRFKLNYSGVYTMDINLFEKVKAAVSSFRPARVLTILLIGLLVITTTACNPPAPRSSTVGSGTSYNDKAVQNPGLREYTDRADGKSRPDLSSYRDESAQDRLSTRAKAEQLSRRAEQNLKKSENPEEFAKEYRSGTPLNERIKNITDSVGKAAEETAEDAAEGTQKGMRNLRRNTEQAADSVRDTAADAQRTARRNLNDAAEYTQDRASEATNSNRT